MFNRTSCLAGTFCLACLSFLPVARGQSLDLSKPRAEAEYLAIEITGQLTPSVSLADRIQADLAGIRTAYPQLADIRVLPDWMPGELLVGLMPDAYAQFKAGSFHGFDSLYATLGVPTAATHDAGQWLRLQFGRMYHDLRLAELFRPVDGVRYAEPNSIVGDGNDVVARVNRTYTLSRGFGDCPAGCITHERWDFTVTDQGVFPGLAPPNGDVNHDGDVNAADYILLRDGWGTSYDETHYNSWRNNFGASSAGGSATAGALVPEPASVALLVLGLALIPRRTWRNLIRPR
jgi:hypothetical protein